MRFSLFYNFDITPGKDIPELYRDVEEQAIVADRLGFDAIWLAEHHFEVYGRLPSPLLYLARIGALTRQIDLATAVIEAPYYHPLRLAEDTALLDVLSAGRVRLGVGSGARMKPEEFIKFGMPVDEKTARTFEVLEVLRQAFDERVVRFNGSFYTFEGAEINPRPVQSAQQLLWIAGSQATPEYAAEHGYGFLIPRVGTGVRHLDLIARYRGALVGQRGFISQLRFVYVAETEQQAREETRDTFSRYAHYDCGVEWDGNTASHEYADLTQRMHFVIGTPDQVVAQLRDWHTQYGFDEIMCQLYAAGMRHTDSLRSLELLGTEVLPRLQTGARAATVQAV